MNSPTATEADRRNVRKRASDNSVSRGRKVKAAGSSKGAATDDGDQGASGSLVQQAIRAVGNYMRDNGLRPGDTLPGEKYFGDELGVSRAVMREAFGALGALQIIDVARGRKPKVRHVDGSLFATSIVHGFNTSQISILDVWEVRKTVELRATEMAATARTDEELKEIQDIVEAIASYMDDADLVSQYNAEFHYAIARASHNVLFAQILASFAPITRIATRAAWKACTTKAMKQAQVTRHRAIVRAIARKDAEAATDAMRQLFDDAIRENWSRLAAHRFSFDPFFDEQGQRPALI
jgi:GntR family transcriptional repressor for pyruvate dehydrogenase complex